MDCARSVERHFSRAAECYDRLGQMHSQLASELVCKVVPQPVPRVVLDLACGTGSVAAALVRRFPESSVDAIDIAPGMIEQAAKRFDYLPQIAWACADVLNTPLWKSYDVVISGSALHWMQPLDKTFEHIAGCLQPSGTFLFSLMAQGTLQELHQLRHELVPNVVPQQQLPSVMEVSNALGKTGFRIEWLDRRVEVLRYQSAQEFFSHIKLQGFTGGALSQGNRFLTRGELQLLMREYDRRYTQGATGVPASYVILMGMARLSS